MTRRGLSIAPRELFLRGSYLKPERSENISQKKFSLVLGDVPCHPDETFEVFVDIDSALSMSKDACPDRSIIVKYLFLVVSYCSLS